MRKKALITGITGQDGSYLAEFLIGKGYEVFGMVRRTSSFSAGRIYPLIDDQAVKLVEGDLLDAMSLRKAIETVLPDEIYNLGAMSDVKSSFHLAEYTSEVNGIGVLRLLEAIRDINPKIRFYQASTSELFGKAQQFPQTEKTPFHPRSPYGISKLYGFWMVTHFREAYQLFACNGILFNHESPRRGESFVSKKISLGVASIILGLNKKLSLGNLNARRDWGYAKDFVEGMWLMLQQEKAEDFVLATGKTHTVREFVERSFQEFGIHIVWEGEGIDEKGVDSSTGRILVDISKEFFRPSEVDHLIGDPSKAYRQLGWQSSTSFEELVSLMVQSDYKYLSAPKRHFEPCFS